MNIKTLRILVIIFFGILLLCGDIPAQQVTQRTGDLKMAVKLPDLGMYGFLKLGKNQREVKWGETITLTPDDATLVSGGKPAFEVYYACREYNGAASGIFKNKIFFNDTVVSIQTNLKLNSMEIRNIHTQAYLGPMDGTLKINIDADNEVKESREDNNFNFIVYLKFQGFTPGGGYKPCGINLSSLSKTQGYPGDTFEMIGTWGPTQGTKIPCINKGGMNKLIVLSWSNTVLKVKIPAGLAPGAYKVGVYCNDLSLGGSYSSGWMDFKIN